MSTILTCHLKPTIVSSPLSTRATGVLRQHHLSNQNIEEDWSAVSQQMENWISIGKHWHLLPLALSSRITWTILRNHQLRYSLSVTVTNTSILSFPYLEMNRPNHKHYHWPLRHLRHHHSRRLPLDRQR